MTERDDREPWDSKLLDDAPVPYRGDLADEQRRRSNKTDAFFGCMGSGALSLLGLAAYFSFSITSRPLRQCLAIAIAIAYPLTVSLRARKNPQLIPRAIGTWIGVALVGLLYGYCSTLFR